MGLLGNPKGILRILKGKPKGEPQENHLGTTENQRGPIGKPLGNHWETKGN